MQTTDIIQEIDQAQEIALVIIEMTKVTEETLIVNQIEIID